MIQIGWASKVVVNTAPSWKISSREKKGFDQYRIGICNSESINWTRCVKMRKGNQVYDARNQAINSLGELHKTN